MGQDTISAEPEQAEHSEGIRVGADLLNATRAFANESVMRSWWHVGSTLILMISALVGAGVVPWSPLRDPARHWDSALAILAHGGLITSLWLFGGFDVALFSVLLPMAIASALGSYLFFAQHSFKRMHIITPEAWTFYRAALESSSYMRLNRIMQWFTGNIGYHHIHHLNVRIPFYRLPEAMVAIPELQSPVTTSLMPKDIKECFQASLWDQAKHCMVTYREANRPV
ncbi:fatty acid desaturase family protein [Sulfuriflexus sp.]|uniref:fatty acid desaturase family protein n=1 Tax=Sulfuriflexus sp. TaxID=2015443 RepID=UPI0028CFB3F2|nr:fatty acid desaturase [Sulfuriflexus sp.]MDT8405126.1 fatty acid desaturase [Sulfuriflexus sp.]